MREETREEILLKAVEKVSDIVYCASETRAMEILENPREPCRRATFEYYLDCDEFMDSIEFNALVDEVVRRFKEEE